MISPWNSMTLRTGLIGAPGTVRAAVAGFIERTQPQELMITSQIFEHAARVHSYKITAQVRDQLQNGDSK